MGLYIRNLHRDADDVPVMEDDNEPDRFVCQAFFPQILTTYVCQVCPLP